MSRNTKIVVGIIAGLYPISADWHRKPGPVSRDETDRFASPENRPLLRHIPARSEPQRGCPHPNPSRAGRRTQVPSRLPFQDGVNRSDRQDMPPSSFAHSEFPISRTS